MATRCAESALAQFAKLYSDNCVIRRVSNCFVPEFFLALVFTCVDLNDESFPWVGFVSL